MNLLLILALTLAPQDLDKTVDELLQRLASDSLVEREEATEALSKLGPDAIPVLEKKLKSAEGELRERIEKALAVLRGDDVKARVLPPLKRVTLKATAKPIADVFAEIRSQTGLPLRFGPKDPTIVTVAIENATPLQALDEVSRQARSIRYMFEGLDKSDPGGMKGQELEDAVVIEDFVDYPSTYVRHYKVAVTNVGLYKSNDFKNNTANAQLSLTINWVSSAQPDALRLLRLEEVTDDRGTALFEPKQDDEDHFWEVDRQDRRHTSIEESFTLAHPADGVRKMARIKGTVAFRYSEGVRKLVFENPEKSVGKTLEFQGLKVTLVSFTVREGGAVVKVSYEGRNHRCANPYSKAQDAESDWAFESDAVQLVLEGGATGDSSGAGGSRSGDKGDWEVEYNYTGASPKAVEVSLVIGYFYDEFEFEIRDVPFPK